MDYVPTSEDLAELNGYLNEVYGDSPSDAEMIRKIEPKHFKPLLL